MDSRTASGGRRIIERPWIRPLSGAPKKRSASARSNPAIWVASSQAEILSAFLIFCLMFLGNTAGRLKRR